MKIPLIATLLGWSLFAHSVEYPSQAEFYSKPENVAMFEKAIESGVLINQSQVYSDGCLKAATTESDKKQCECAADFVKTVPAKEFFYESHLSYLMYQDTVRAKVISNSDLAAEIKKYLDDRQGLTKKIAAACPAKQ